jgi:hypothetical protein
LTDYPYKEDGILPDGSKVPDIPVMNFLIVTRDRQKGLLGESIVDTGFDTGIYANLNLGEFLEGAAARKTASLQATGRDVICEVFDVECYIMDQDSKPVLRLGRVDAYCPIDPQAIEQRFRESLAGSPQRDLTATDSFSRLSHI